MPVAVNWAIIIGYAMVWFIAAVAVGCSRRWFPLAIPIVIVGWLGGAFWLLPLLSTLYLNRP